MYLCGRAAGSFGGSSGGPWYDPWLARYDSAGNQLWIRQFGTSSYEEATGVAPDGLGGVYVSGYAYHHTAGSYEGSPAVAWLARYDGAGNQLWYNQFLGTGYAPAVVPDGAGGAFVSGTLYWTNFGLPNAWLSRYDGAGNLLWIRWFQTTSLDYASTVAQDGAGGVYISGKTSGNLGGPNAGETDAWLARVDGAGNQLWIKQFGTSGDDAVENSAPDGSGGVYISGGTKGSLGGPNAGFDDAWLARYDSAGIQLWIRQLGTSNSDFAACAAPDGSGGVFVGGETAGSLGGQHAGSWDAWLARYDGAGNQLWIGQLGTAGEDTARAVATNGAGGAFLGGSTQGSLGGPNAGGFDVWLARYDGGCEAPSVYCTAQFSSSGCLPSISASGVPSLSTPSTFLATGSNLEVNQNGIMFFGTSGQNNLPFGGGLLCVKSPLYRLKIKNTGTGASCAGTLSYSLLEMLAHPQGGPQLVLNQTVNLQTWFRDPSHASTTGLSNGLQFKTCP